MVCAKNLPSSGFFTVFISMIVKVASGGPHCAAVSFPQGFTRPVLDAVRSVKGGEKSHGRSPCQQKRQLPHL